MAAKKTKEQRAFTLTRPVRLSHTSQLKENELSRGGEYSTVQYSTVRCKKCDGGKGRREEGKGRGPGSVFYLDVLGQGVLLKVYLHIVINIKVPLQMLGEHRVQRCFKSKPT